MGRSARVGSAQQLFDDPRHPYTEALLAAATSLDEDDAANIRLPGTVPDPVNPPQGCRSHTRFPVATPISGWEVDDAVHQLERRESLLEGLSSVRRLSSFTAELAFDDPDRAATAARELNSAPTPE